MRCYARLACEVFVVVYALGTVLMCLLNFASFWHTHYQANKNKQNNADSLLDVEFLVPKTMMENLSMKGPRLFQLTADPLSHDFNQQSPGAARPDRVLLPEHRHAQAAEKGGGAVLQGQKQEYPPRG